MSPPGGISIGGEPPSCSGKIPICGRASGVDAGVTGRLDASEGGPLGKGYAEGPAAEEAERRRDELARGTDGERAGIGLAVFGCTEEQPERHFLGWLGEVDPDELFASGAAWGIAVVERAR